MAKTTTAGAAQAPATLEEAVALAQSYKEKLEAAGKDADELATINADSIQAQNEAILKLEADAKKSEKTIADLKSELEDAAEVISELKTQAASAGAGKSKGPVVEIDKSKYLIVGGTVIKQKIYLPADLAADKQLCKKLIEKGSTLFVKLN